MTLHEIAQRLERNVRLSCLRSDCTIHNQGELADAGRQYLVDAARASSLR